MTREHKCVPAGPDAIFTWEKCHSGRPDRTRKRSRFLHGWHSGPAPGRPGRRWPGDQKASAPPPAGGSHREGGTRPTGKEAHPGRSGDPDPAAAALEPTIKRPLASVRAPRQGHRRRGGDSPRADGSPRRRPRAARRWRPDPWLRPSGGARVRYRACPVPRCPPRSATRRHQRALALSALDCERLVTWVPASPTPDSDVLSNRPLPPFPGTRTSNFRSREACRGP